MALLPGSLTALTLSLAKLADRARTALVNRRAARELLEWDDRALKDLGLTRSDVRGALALPLSEDPTLALSLIAAGGDSRSRRAPSTDRMAPPIPAAAQDRRGILPSAQPALCT